MQRILASGRAARWLFNVTGFVNIPSNFGFRSGFATPGLKQTPGFCQQI
jgi:hypothetical protein